MTADDAWVAIAKALGRHGVFGYGFTADDCHVVMSCHACDGEEHVPLQDATAVSIALTVHSFEGRHLISCANRIAGARERLNAMANGAPVATTPDEARRLMAELPSAHWPVGNVSRKGEA